MRETQNIQSLEGFLDLDEATEVLDDISSTLGERRATFEVNARQRSVHEIPGFNVPETIAVYEPAGRIEFDEIPGHALRVLFAATNRRLADIRRSFPSVTKAASWFYVEYGKGQFVSPHIDYPVDNDEPTVVKYAAISVTLRAPDVGGEFYIGTSGNQSLWDGGSVRPRSGADPSSAWFRELPTTRWHARPLVGDALCWGTELIHGTEPVRSGTAAKVIGLLY